MNYNEKAEIDLDQAKAILKVAYLLAALDGEICEQEKAKFRALMRQLFGERYADADVMAYLEDVAADASKLIGLRDFYSDDEEILRAFLEKTSGTVARIMAEVYVTRCAFAIWISICCADNEYSEIERSAVKQLQNLVNSCTSAGKISSVACKCVGISVLGILGGVRSVAVGNSKGSGSGGCCISDRFLAHVENCVKKIGEFYAKMEKATHADIKRNYQDMCEFEIQGLKEFLAAK